MAFANCVMDTGIRHFSRDIPQRDINRPVTTASFVSNQNSVSFSVLQLNTVRLDLPSDLNAKRNFFISKTCQNVLDLQNFKVSGEFIGCLLEHLIIPKQSRQISIDSNKCEIPNKTDATDRGQESEHIYHYLNM